MQTSVVPLCFDYFCVYFPGCEIYFSHDIKIRKLRYNDKTVHAPTPCLTHWIYIRPVTPQSITDDVPNALLGVKIVTWACEQYTTAPFSMK